MAFTSAGFNCNPPRHDNLSIADISYTTGSTETIIFFFLLAGRKYQSSGSQAELERPVQEVRDTFLSC